MKNQNLKEVNGSMYFGLQDVKEVKANAKKYRKQYLRYKEAEIVYSIQHKKLLELAGKAGALVRMGGYVLIDRDIFDSYLEQFREPSTLIAKKGSFVTTDTEEEANVR